MYNQKKINGIMIIKNINLFDSNMYINLKKCYAKKKKHIYVIDLISRNGLSIVILILLIIPLH